MAKIVDERIEEIYESVKETTASYTRKINHFCRYIDKKNWQRAQKCRRRKR